MDKRSKLISIASVGLVCAWLMPNHYPPWAAFHAEALAALALLPLAMWLGMQGGAVCSLAIGAFALSIVPLLQFAAGQIHFAGDAWMAWLYVVGFGLAAQSGAALVRGGAEKPRPLEVLVPIQVGILAASLLSTGLAARQWLDLGFISVFVVEKSTGSRPYANLAQPNQLASLLMLGLAASAFLYESAKVRARFAIAAALVIVSGLAMTQSRTALLGLALAWVAYFGLRRQAQLRTTIGALAAITACYACLAFAWPALDNALLLEHAPSLTERMDSNLRVVVWRSMLDAVAMHPWAGWGAGQVALAQQATALDSPPTYWWFESAHNLLLDIAVWAGIPVSLAVGIALFIWFARRVTSCRDPLSWCLFVGIGCLFCHAMVEYPLSYAYFLLPIGLLMGALGEQPPKERVDSTGRQRRAPRILIAVMTLIAATAYGKVVSEYLVLEQEWRELRLSRALVGEEEPEPSRNIFFLTQLQARANFYRIQPSAPMSQEQLDQMKRVAQRFGSATFLFPYAKALALNGQLTESGRQLELICRTQHPSVCAHARREWSSSGFSSVQSAIQSGEPPGTAP